MGYIHEVTNSSPAQTGKSRPSLQPDARAKLLTTTVFQARMSAKMSGGNRKQETGGTVRGVLLILAEASFDRLSAQKHYESHDGCRQPVSPPLLQFLFQQLNKTHPPPLQYDVLQLNGYFLRRSDKLHENLHFFSF